MSQYPLRVPDYLLDQAREAAKEENVSINQLFLAFISDGMGQRRALRSLQERAARGDPARALALLESLPDHGPEADDRMPEALQSEERR
ncbi:hypothetical protein C8J35_102379 [Rhizobium sp. PP-F2F-G38]|nr:hypothetical protein C8J37_102379 [Rhizobium sp. PP-WC-1G-195]PYE99490.1 hypothetical protein C8J35_102379 [Rhizobium sp. PP-F2F-G38]TCQ12320.1 hypothetical protein C8J34_101961 [Rhizobium sp. PP-F2F-G36]